MAAPTAGGVLAEILPYLGLEPAREAAVEMPDTTGLDAKEAAKALKALGLEVRAIGSEKAVTGQIPAAGEDIVPGTQVILYLGDTPDGETTTVPDFVGMTIPQANEAAGNAGLYLSSQGNVALDAPVQVIQQDTPPGTQVPVGTKILLRFADPSPSD
jgi:beta-lactam-binding protein with PASTA domain